MVITRPSNAVALGLLVAGFSGCIQLAEDISTLPEPSLDSTLLVGDYRFVAKGAMDIQDTALAGRYDLTRPWNLLGCDPADFVAHHQVPPLAANVIAGVNMDRVADDELAVVIDSLFNSKIIGAECFYLRVLGTLAERELLPVDRAGPALRRFMLEHPCRMLCCCCMDGHNPGPLFHFARIIGTDLSRGSARDRDEFVQAVRERATHCSMKVGFHSVGFLAEMEKMFQQRR